MATRPSVGSSANRSANRRQHDPVLIVSKQEREYGNTTQCWIVNKQEREYGNTTQCWIAATRPSVGSSANRSANRRQHDPVLDRQQTGARIGGNTTQCWNVSKQERE
ncbi:hypothetical protein EVAR_33465_1 [Eumeta japonica]|uniref:Uncharacterized protein n=1 Tax=Eumeta variegata TaxID=151549 RepID=A0A4C1WF04_EUMVA|nr:hypothetical protein EVAR_33465_1 [Eumeta japonica]